MLSFQFLMLLFVSLRHGMFGVFLGRFESLMFLFLVSVDLVFFTL